MRFAETLRSVRHEAGLTQSDLARLADIARPNITAYESGRREPRVATATVLLAAAGATWRVDRPILWRWTEGRRLYAVPSRLWRLPAGVALRSFEAGTHLWWSGPPRHFDLAQRRDRLRAYEIILREGTPEDITSTVDGVLLCEAWADLVLPVELRSAWEPVVDQALDAGFTIDAAR